MGTPGDDEAICIVSRGCVLPDAANPEEFWRNIVNNHGSIGPLPESRWKRRLFFSSNRKDPDSSYSHFGACISDEIMGKIEKKFAHVKSAPRLHLLALEATAQALASTSHDPDRTSIYLGCTNHDEAAGLLSFLRHDSDTVKQHMDAEDWERFQEYFNLPHRDDEYYLNVGVTSSVLNRLRREFSIRGFSALIDAACASSLVAMALGVFALRAHETDCVVAGGVDANLAPESFVIFCRAGVMAETRSIPFSRSSEGLLQGEGAVVLVLKRLSDARASGDRIHAVIRGAGISNNGRASSLFQLSVPALVLAYRRAYGESPVPSMDFIEAHATGTRQGDDAELASIKEFFPEQPIALSSVKTMIGHTKATAGAASALKGILMIEHRSIPPFLLSDGSSLPSSMSAYLPATAVSLDRKIINGGISAFGFGGTNAYIHLSSFDEAHTEDAGSPMRPAVKPGGRASSIALVAKLSIEMNKLEDLESHFDLRIPLKSYPQIEPLQRMAVIAARNALASAGIDETFIDHDTTGVLCGSTTGIVVARNLAYRLHYAQMNAPFDDERYGKALLMKLRSRYPLPTRDTGPGMLKNIVACRVAHYLDLHGPCLAVDYDEASYAASLAVAKTYLHDHHGLIIVIGTEDIFDSRLLYFEPRMVDVSLLCSLSYAEQHRLPVISILKEVRFSDEQ
jgi:acyl transferase domain-containing protein